MNKNFDDIADLLTKNMSKLNTEMINYINLQNNKLLNYIIDSNNKILHNSIDNEELHNKKLKDRMQITLTINNKLKDIMNYTNALRVIILEFHNSNLNLVGIPFAKFSATYEWFKKNTLPIQNAMKSVPFSTISSVVSDIMQSDASYVEYNDVNKLMYLNPSLSSILSLANAKSVIFNAMYDDRNYLLGLLAVEFNNEIPEYINLVELNNDVVEITSLLNLNYKYNHLT